MAAPSTNGRDKQTQANTHALGLGHTSMQMQLWQNPANVRQHKPNKGLWSGDGLLVSCCKRQGSLQAARRNS